MLETGFTKPPIPKVKVTVCLSLSLTKFLVMLEWIIILLYTIIFPNKMMCHAHHPATYSQSQGHNLGSNIVRLQFCVCAVSSTCVNGFWYYFKKLFSITRWCGMPITQPTMPKVKVTVWTQTFSPQFRVTAVISCSGCMLEWILILLHKIVLHNKMTCHAHLPATSPPRSRSQFGLKHCLTAISCWAVSTSHK